MPKQRKPQPRPAMPTLVVFLLDKSGSMMDGYSATIEAFNGFKNGLRETPKLKMSLVQFCTVSVLQSYTNLDILEVPDLTPETYRIGGGTPLVDATYKTIMATQDALKSMMNGTKVVFCIQTDGEENASREHTNDQLKLLIEQCQGYGWQFNFMGAGINSFHQSRKWGISDEQSISYDSSQPNMVRETFFANAHNTSAYASGLVGNTNYSAVQRMKSGDKFYGKV